MIQIEFYRERVLYTSDDFTSIYGLQLVYIETYKCMDSYSEY